MSRFGVTFVEITATVLIMGILASVAVPVYSNSLLRYRTEVTAQRIAQDIVQTQRIARQTNSTRTILFTLVDNSLEISGISSMDHAGQPYKVYFDQVPFRTMFSSLVTAAQPATQLPSVALDFDRFGMPNQGISVTVQAGTIQKRVDVTPITGRVSVQ